MALSRLFAAEPQRSATTLRHRRLYQGALLLSDVLMLGLAFRLAYWLRFYGGVALQPDVLPTLDFYLGLAVLLIPLWLGLFALYRLYDFGLLLGGTAEYAAVYNACTTGVMAVVVATFLQTSFVVSRAWLVMAWLLSSLLVSVGRFALRRGAYLARRRGLFVARALMIGDNDEAWSLAQQFQDVSSSGLHFVGMVSTEAAAAPEARPSAALARLGGLDELPSLVARLGVQRVIIASTSVNREQLLTLFETLSEMEGVEIFLSAGLFEVLTTGVQVRTMASVPLLSMNRMRLDALESALKGAMDYTLSALGLLLLAPLLVGVALLVKLDSPGPIFYRRRVLGVGGRTFGAFKFRTMVVDGDAVLARHPAARDELEATHKLVDDPRVTRVGRWLRRYSVDEIPQLFNVLLGQMSLVGPRMISPAEARNYGRLRRNLFTVKPGLTGLWQVSGRSDVSYEERVQLDMHYIRNYSFWQDVQILFVQTLPAVFKGRGAY